MLSAAHSSGSSFSSIVLWSISILLLALGGLFLVLQLKKRVTHVDEAQPTTGFTLADLRQLHRTGQMSEMEYEKAKAKMLEVAQKGGLRQELSRDAGTSSAEDGGGQTSG